MTNRPGPALYVVDSTSSTETADMETDAALKPGGDDPPPPPPRAPAVSDAKHRAKRFNEHIKAGYGLLNTLAAAVIVTAWIGPAIQGSALPLGLDTAALVCWGICRHSLGHAAIRFGTKKEE